MRQATPLVEIRDATVVRGGRRVFDRLSLTLDSHTSTVILGPNGAGKSTLLRLITRELFPLHLPGALVRVLGRERWRISDLRREIGLVSSELQAGYPADIPALEVVASALLSSTRFFSHQGISPADLARAEGELERAGALALRHRRFGELSAGEQRRVLLARALVHDPPTLLLDEPTTSLDLRAAHGLLALLGELVRGGKQLVLVTHRIEEILPEIERAILLKDGAVMADGPTGETLTDGLLSELYDTPLRVLTSGGRYAALPADG